MPEVIASTRRANYATEVQSGSRQFICDEPVARGGQDAGPTPTELIVGALAACTSITLRMYADRKGWDVEAIHVSVNWTRLADKTLSAERVLKFEGHLDDTRKSRMAEIAERTPVTLALKAGMKIETRLA